MSESLYPFVNETTYDRAALTALNDLAEKSVRKEKSRRTRYLCTILGLAGLVAGVFCYKYQTMVGSLLLLYGVLLLVLALNWKSFQLRSSQRQLQQGVRVCTYEFDDDEIICNTGAGVNRYSYEQIYAVAADAKWYAIFFDMNNGIIIDRNGFTEGDDMFFKGFIGQHAQLPIQDF